MSSREITQHLKLRARELGFALSGVAPAVAPGRLNHLDEWLAAGYAGQMHYIADRREAYEHPNHVLDGVRSILMLGMAYPTEPCLNETHDNGGYGRVARYAWGNTDYHDTIRDSLHKLADYLRTLLPTAKTRGIVDTAPLLERDFAQLAGLGWVGKNTLLLNKHAGSYFFLAALLTDAELEYDAPHAADHCGTCTACLDACPTRAFPQPYVLDATRCISYLTIELHDAIPPDLRPGLGDLVFGCDICQEVCPWNEKGGEVRFLERANTHEESQPANGPAQENNAVSSVLELTELFDLDEEGFRLRFRHIPLWRAHRRGLLRSAAIVLGNQRAALAVSALAKGLNDSEPIVRSASAWALGQISTPEARIALNMRRKIETDAAVLQEIDSARLILYVRSQ